MENKMVASELKSNNDMDAFLDFRRQWEDGTLTDDHPVVAATTKWAQTVARRFNCLDRAGDLRQMALISLAKSSYRGEAALDTYIMRILTHANIAEWRKSGGKKLAEFPAEMIDKKSQELFEKVLRRVSSDKLMEELLQKRPEVQQAIVLIVARAEEQVGRLRLAKAASTLLGRKVTRHEVEAALKQLREAFTRSSNYHKASAG